MSTAMFFQRFSSEPLGSLEAYNGFMNEKTTAKFSHPSLQDVLLQCIHLNLSTNLLASGC